MADDFNIKVTTTADTSGIKQTEAELDRINAKVATTVPVAPPPPPVPPVIPPVPPVGPNDQAVANANAERAAALVAATEADNAAKLKGAAIDSERVAIAQTRLALQTSLAEGDEAQSAILQSELGIRSATLAVMRSETLTEGELNALTENQARLLALVNAETQAAAGSSILMGASFGKARGEAVVLARELATGGNYIRTMGSLLGALGVPISIAATLAFVLYTHFKKTAEEEKKMTEEMGRLNIEAEKTAISFDRIRTAADLSKETETIRTNIELLRNKQAVETDPKKLSQLQAEISIQETLLNRLGIRSQHALELAAHEKQVGVVIADQVHDLELADKSFERARDRVKEQATVEKELNAIRLQSLNVKIAGAADRGEITQAQAEVATAQAKMGIEAADYAIQKKSLEDQISLIGQQGSKAKENLADQETAVKNVTDQQTKEAELAREVEVLTQRRKDAQKVADDARKAEESAAGGVTGFSSKNLADQAAASEKLHAATLDAQKKEQAAADQLNETQKKAAVAQDPEHQKALTDEIRKQQSILEERGKAYQNARDAEDNLLPKLKEELQTTLQILQAREAAAKAALEAKVQETEFNAFKAAGSSVSGTIAANQQAERQANLQRTLFDAQRTAIRDDIAHGAVPDKDLLKAFGTAEEQPTPEKPAPSETSDERNARLSAERESSFDQAFHPDWQQPPPKPAEPTAPRAGTQAQPAWTNKLIEVLNRLEQAFQ